MTALQAGCEPEVGVEVEVGGEVSCRLSQGTQTGEGEEVQITAPLAELLQRIEAFTQYKRHQLDLSNQLEFCAGSRSDSEGTCARTGAVYTRKGREVSHISTIKVRSSSGPTTPPPPPLEQLRRALQPPATWAAHRPRLVSSAGLLGLTERIAAMEQHMGLYSEGPTSRDLLQRVCALEQRLLQLEGASPEYPRPRLAAKSLPPHPCPSPSPSSSSLPTPPSGHPAHVDGDRR